MKSTSANSLILIPPLVRIQIDVMRYVLLIVEQVAGTTDLSSVDFLGGMKIFVIFRATHGDNV
jgi:hypothetical protein